MKAFVLTAVALGGLMAATPGEAGFWSGEPGFEIRFSPAHQQWPNHHGGPYFVGGWGDDHYGGQRRYWGGPSFAVNSGSYPPYETHKVTKHRQCPNKLTKITSDLHRHVRRCY